MQVAVYKNTHHAGTGALGLVPGVMSLFGSTITVTFSSDRPPSPLRRASASQSVRTVEYARFGNLPLLFGKRSIALGSSAVAEEWATTAMERFDVFDWSRLNMLIPADFTPGADRVLMTPDGHHDRITQMDDAVVVVDGPAMLAGDDVLDIPPLWMEAFDAAILVVMKRRTTTTKLEETVAWLEAAGIPPIGIVWNQHHFPPVTDVLDRWREKLSDWVAS